MIRSEWFLGALLLAAPTMPHRALVGAAHGLPPKPNRYLIISISYLPIVFGIYGILEHPQRSLPRCLPTSDVTILKKRMCFAMYAVNRNRQGLGVTGTRSRYGRPSGNQPQYGRIHGAADFMG